MGRRTLQIKRIVIEIALVVFAGHGRLYEFCSGERIILQNVMHYGTGADMLKTIRYVFEDHVGMSTINLVGPVEND